MRRVLTILAVAFGVAALGGCGSGGQPEEELGRAGQRVDAAQGDLVLAEVEYAQAAFREAPEQFSGKPAKIATARRRSLSEAHHLERECHEGNGLESCDSIEAVEEVVKELDQEAKSAH